MCPPATCIIWQKKLKKLIYPMSNLPPLNDYESVYAYEESVMEHQLRILKYEVTSL